MNSNLRIEKLILNNFRNHNYLKLDIKKNMVLIYGKNGSGKTSVLESISLFDSSNGFKALSLNETINFNYTGPLEMFGVNLSLKTPDSSSTVGLSLRKKNNILRKVVSIDGKLSKNLDSLESIVERQNCKTKDILFFIDHNLSIGDLAIWGVVKWLKSGVIDFIPTSLIDKYSNLNRILNSVSKIPKIKEWQDKKH